MTEDSVLSCLVLFATLSVSQASSTCFVANSYYESCEYGCCGSAPYEECCDNTVGLIVGLVVAFIVIVLIIVVVVCVIVHYKSNQVVRMVNSATSTRNNANITILHMGSDNPYQHAPQQPGNTLMVPQHPAQYPCQQPAQYPKQHSLMQPHGQSGLQQSGKWSDPAPGFPAPPSPKFVGSGCDPAYPHGASRQPGGGSSVVMAPAASTVGGPGTGTSSSTLNGGPAVTSASTANGNPWATSSSTANGNPWATSSSTANGNPWATSSSAMNGGPRALSPVTSKKGGPPTTSSLPRKVPPLPVIPTAAEDSTSDPPPVISAFGAPSKAGARAKEPSNVGLKTTAKPTAGDNGNMGLEDFEDFY